MNKAGRILGEIIFCLIVINIVSFWIPGILFGVLYGISFPSILILGTICLGVADRKPKAKKVEKGVYSLYENNEIKKKEFPLYYKPKCPNCSMELQVSGFCEFCGWEKKKPEEKTENRSRTISKAVQREVWRRDQGRCVQCDSKERLEFDHIIPFSKGGSNTARNIQLLCEICNRKKYNKI